MDYSHHVDQVRQLLASEKVTKRKEGLKMLQLQLDNPDFLTWLDRKTAQLKLHQKLPVASWAGLVLTYVTYAAAEITSHPGRKKPPDPGVSRVFKKLLQQADNKQRCGGRLQLQRAAARLLDHIANVLAVQGILSAAIGVDYTQALKNQLLTVPRYCSSSTAAVFQDLLLVFAARFDELLEQPSPSLDEAQRVVSMLHLLLSRCPGDLGADFQQDLLKFFQDSMARLYEKRDMSRVTAVLTNALVVFLCRHGLDLPTSCGALALQLLPLTRLAWAEGRHSKLKEAFVLYERVQLKVGALQSTCLNEMLQLAMKDIGADNFKWELEAREGPGIINKASYSYAAFAASLMYFKATANEDKDTTYDSGDSANGPTAKRAKRTPILHQLWDDAVSNPTKWAPIACLLLTQHSYGLEKDMFVYATGAVCAALPTALETASRAASMGEVAVVNVVWLLRMLQGLAECWMESGREACKEVQTRCTAAAEQLLHFLGTADLLPVLFDESAQALAALHSNPRCCPTPSTNKVLSVWLEAGCPMREAALKLVTASASASTQQGAASGLQSASPDADVSWTAVHKCIEKCTGQVSPQLFTSAIMAILGAAHRPPLAPPSTPPLWTRLDADALHFEHVLSTMTHGYDDIQRQLYILKLAQAKSAACDSTLPANLQLPVNQSAPVLSVSGASSSSPHQRLVSMLQQSLGTGRLTPAVGSDKSLQASQDAGAASRQLLSNCMVAAEYLQGVCRGDGGGQRLGENESLLAQRLSEGLVVYVQHLIGNVQDGGAVDQDLIEFQQLVSRCLPLLSHSSARSLLSGAAEQAAAKVHVAMMSRQEALGRGSGDHRDGSPFVNSPQARSPSVDDMFLDDDLDAGGPTQARGGSRKVAMASTQSASTATGASGSSQVDPLTLKQLNLARTLQVLAPLTGGRVGHKAVLCLQYMEEDNNAAPSDQLQEALVEVVVLAIALGGAVELMADALQLMNEEGGLLRSKALTSARLQFVLQMLQLLGSYLHQQQVNARLDDESLIDQTIEILAAVTKAMQKMREKSPEGSCPIPWQLLVQHGIVVAVAITLQPTRFAPGSGDLYHLTESLLALLSDENFQVRRVAGELVLVLLEIWPHHVAIFGSIRQHITLLDGQPSGTPPTCPPEQLETSLLALMQLAITSPKLEVQVLVLLLAQSCLEPTCAPLVQSILCYLATYFGYPTRHAYLGVHASAFAWGWIKAGFEVQQLLALHELVWGGCEKLGGNWDALRDLSSAEGAPHEMISAWCPELLSVLVGSNDKEAVEQLARYMSTPAESLMLHHFDVVYGSWWPYNVTPSKELTQEALRGPVMSELMSVDKMSETLNSKLCKVVARMLMLVMAPSSDEDPSDGMEPFFTETIIAAAIHAIPGQPTPEENETVLWRSILKGYNTAWLLLSLHAHLNQALHPRHQIARLAAFKAWLGVMGTRVAAPGVARYTLHILLQQLRIPALQKAVSTLLGFVVQALATSFADVPEQLEVYCRLVTPVISAVVDSLEAKRQAVQMQAWRVERVRQEVWWGGLRPAVQAVHDSSRLPTAVACDEDGGTTSMLAPAGTAIMSSVQVDLQTASRANISAWQTQLSTSSCWPLRASGWQGVDSPGGAPVADGESDMDPLVTLLLKMTSDAPIPLQHVLHEAPPLPELPQLEAARQLQAAMQKDQHLPRMLTHFADSASLMQPATRERAVGVLSTALVERRTEIFEPTPAPSGTAQGSTFAQPALCGEVLAAAWKLAHLSHSLSDPGVSLLAGKLLACAGPLGPGVEVPSLAAAPGGHGTVLSAPRTAPAADLLDKTTASTRRSRSGGNRQNANNPADSSSSDVPRGPSPRIVLVANVLLLLERYLVDPAVAVIRTAQYTLRHLLGSVEGKDGIQYLPLSVSRCLEAFQQESRGDFDPSTVSTGAGPGLDSPTLWDPALSASYEEWLCQLSSTLCRSCHDTLLLICSRMMRRKVELAELLLPHIFTDLALTVEGAAGLQSSIARGLSMYVMKEEDGSIKAQRLILKVFEHLRNLHRTAYVNGESKGSLDQDSPMQWHKVFCLELDYLQVARVALRCQAYFTALIYVQHWCEEYGGNGVAGLPCLLSRTAEVDDKQAAAKNLLLHIFTHINEPDSIYAVADQPDLSFQVALLEHEGRWDRALIAYDLLSLQSSNPHAITPPPPPPAPISPHASNQAGPSPPANAAQNPSGQTNNATASGGLSASAAPQLGLVRSLLQLGCVETARQYLHAVVGQQRDMSTAGQQHGPSKQASAASTPLQELQYQLAWQLTDWMIPQAGSSTEATAPAVQGSGSFNASMLQALSALTQRQEAAFKSIIRAAMHHVVSGLASSSRESMATLNKHLVHLRMVEMLSEAWDVQVEVKLEESGGASEDAEGGSRKEAVEQWWRKWRVAECKGRPAFSMMQALMIMQCNVLGVLGATSCLQEALLSMGCSARKAGAFAPSWSSLQRLLHLTPEGAGGGGGPVSDTVLAARLEMAKLSWAQGQGRIAVQAVKSLLSTMEKDPSVGADGCLAALALSCLGKWSAQAQLEGEGVQVMVVLGQAAEKLMGADSGVAAGDVACKVLHRLASYADGLYKDAVAQRTSPDARTRALVVEHKKKQIVQLKARLQERGLNEHQKRYVNHMISRLQKPVEIDEAAASALKRAEQTHLDIALGAYRRCLMAGSKYDLEVVFRLCQIWFSLSDSTRVNGVMDEVFTETPSYKFVPLVYQIASRLGPPASRTPFHTCVSKILIRLARDHPYHTLYQLYGLKNGNLGPDGKPSAHGADAWGVMVHQTDMDKVEGARYLLQKLGKDKKVADVVKQVCTMVDAYIELAAVPVPSGDGPGMPFPASIRRKVQNLHLVPLVSIHLDVDPSGSYQDLPHFVSFQDRISFVGGINKPKLVLATDSAGREVKQLVKSGNDDLRQDLVMQQFFGLVNSLLADSPEATRRQLSMVTYRVVPFSPAAGLLEWVEDTIPLGDYLLGRNRVEGAHGKYGKGSMNFIQCFRRLQNVPPGLLLQRFNEVCNDFFPVLHHFFLEAFRDPERWFKAQTAYTRSTAVNSMAGYIIGLGDRHSGNILLSRSTAGVVHIDLGVAFEQGRFLNTPELVPFRLTRDVVDGMGVTSVEGTFRRSCEETLTVLRMSKESLLTVVEVVLHDPLYRWAMTPYRANQRQKEDLAPLGSGHADERALDGSMDESPLGNADAERAVLRVRQKLEGVEMGDGQPRTVAGQVQALIRDAQDPDKLCRMYVGWGAWV